MPAVFERWNGVDRRSRRWSEAGVFEALLAALAGAWAGGRQMIHSTDVRAHAQAGGNEAQALGRSRGGFSTKLGICADGGGRPLEVCLTGGRAASGEGSNGASAD